MTRPSQNPRALHVRAFALIVACITIASCAPRQPAPEPIPASKPVAVAVSANVELEPLDLSPDGELRLLVRLHYRDASGLPVHVPPGGHVDVYADRGNVQWQPRVRYGDPAAIVRLTEPGPLALRVTSDLPRVPRVMHATTDTRAWRLPAVTARALGPHAVVIGWFPRVHSGTIRIERSASETSDASEAAQRTVTIVAAPASSFRDTSVIPGAHYTYGIERPGADRIIVGVDVPPDLPRSDLAVVRGKGMWLSFDDDVARWNVDAMLARAQAAGIRVIELRMTYGELAEITPVRKPIVDRLIDGAAERGIAIVGWTVPRAVTYEDLAANVAAAGYRTARGHGVNGLAVDLERGPEFLDAPNASSVLSDDIGRLREAVGSHVLLVATVEDPQLERLPDDAIPYAAIARSADVLQPMSYWRARVAGRSIAGMRVELTQSYRRLVQLAGREIPIDIGGQTADLGNRSGAPPPVEIAASVTTARELGAIGETFFDWNGTSAGQWAVLGTTPWPPGPSLTSR